MKNITVVKIDNREKYGLSNQKYGILVRSMKDTALVNLSSNKGGMCINIAHSDYNIVSSDSWDVHYGRVVITCGGNHIPTGLKIWD